MVPDVRGYRRQQLAQATISTSRSQSAGPVINIKKKIIQLAALHSLPTIYFRPTSQARGDRIGAASMSSFGGIADVATHSMQRRRR